MCYFLYIASPLTLSEVRSMLPTGLTAELASSPNQQALKAVHPQAQTVARILSGRCSCDLVRARLPETKADERYLRERYRRLQLPRSQIIAALERHRAGSDIRHTREEWPAELSRFVAEHVRNAGPTLYYLSFSADAGAVPPLGDVRRIGAAEVIAGPGDWLAEKAPTVVTR